MKIRKSFRIPIGFLIGAVYIVRADPSGKTFFIGAAIMIFGEFIRFVSAGTLIKFEGVTQNGIYSYTRNPLYIGSFLIGTGACIIGMDLLFTLIFVVSYPLIYMSVIRREEQFLINRYGNDYRLYISEVPRIIPRRFNLREALGETAPFLAVKNRELLTVAGIIAVWVIMVIKLVF